MTLEELLALLPDNDTGEIDAVDLRTIVTELWDRTEANATAIQANADALTQTNLNFNALFTQVQDHETRITALEGEVSANATAISNNGDLIGAAQAQADANREAVLNYAAATNARLDTLETATRTVAGVFYFDGQPGGNPSDGEFTSDTGDLDNATWLRFDNADANGTDFGTVISQATKIVGQERDDASNKATYDITGAVTEVNGDYQVPVTVTSSQGHLGGGPREITILFAIPVTP